MALFLSTFINKIDQKGRVSVPAQFRSSLTNETSAVVVVYESFINDCVEGCDLNRIKNLSESIDDLDPFSEERDAFAAVVLGGSIQLNIDSDGRIILPETLLKKAKISDKVLFVGKGSTFEIWQPERFEKYLVEAKKQAKDKRNFLKTKKENQKSC